MLVVVGGSGSGGGSCSCTVHVGLVCVDVRNGIIEK